MKATDVDKMKALVEAKRKEADEKFKGPGMELSNQWAAECVLEDYCGLFIKWRNNPTLGGPKWPTCPGNPAMTIRCERCQLRKQYDEHPDDYEPALKG